MTKNSKISKASRDALGRTFMRDLIHQLHTNGLLTDEDLNDKDVVYSKTQKYLSKHKGNLDIVIIPDHREDILDTADDLNKKGHTQLAISLYATFIEHTLNKIISIECSYKNIDRKTQTEIIKTNIGKCTWLFKLLGLPQLKPQYVKMILKISEERNSYLHYKWKPSPDKISDEDKTEKDKQEKIDKIKALIKYLKNYDTKHHYRGQKSRIIKVTRKDK